MIYSFKIHYPHFENTHCDYCHACAYRYQCDCLFSQAGVACSHIHLVMKYIDQSARNEMIYETDSPMDLASDVPFYRPPTDAASSFSPSGLRRTEIAVFDRNSNSNREKEHESDITQRMDELNNIFSRAYHGLRKQRKDGDEEFEKNLEAAELALKNLLTPSNNHGFVTRVDGNKASKTAREAMHSPALKPAHFSCTLSNKSCMCSPHSQSQLYPANYQEEVDSDEMAD
ncbi:hypothetical protein L3Y34_012960 [Caenorhabditis briggsae]|uniref:SWIM-type domain-containing protein n=1 Tax=Caenorhabditis briggsae TaxID=6238 RepID=A0AAE8ZQH4_CAEBR|nr:hypothetical protein L3Y34_012960 [Caenorhabditis briggsae]